MEDFYFKDDWHEILKEHREKLVYDNFDRTSALSLALIIIENAKDEKYGDVAIKIYEDETIIFSYKMGNTGLTNDAWMMRKLAVTKISGYSSLESLALSKRGLIKPFWNEREDNFAPCGGCFPLYDTKQNRTPYTVLVSGLPHFNDHNLIAESIAKHKNIKVNLLTK